MPWRDAWRLSDRCYPEISYQAIYAVRQGNLPSSVPSSELVARARRRVQQSKLLVSFVLAILNAGAFAAMGSLAQANFGAGLPLGLYQVGVVAGLLILEVALLWWTALQVLPTYLASNVVPFLETLPIPRPVVDRAAFLLLLRLVDAPAITCLVLTPVVVGVAFGSPLAGLAVLPGVFASIVAALSFALLTARFFVRRVQGAGGGHGQTALRWTYLVLWAIPAFAMYGSLAIAPKFFGTLAGLLAGGPRPLLDLLLSAYPFPLAFLPLELSRTAPPTGLVGGDILAITAAAVAYFLATGWTAQWLIRAPRLLAVSTSSQSAPGVLRSAGLTSRGIVSAVLRRDLRTASRTPGFAFLILLPLLDAFAIGIWTVLANPSNSDAFNIAAGAVSTAALLATFFGPAFFAIEVLGYSYNRTLPIPERSLLLGKVSLVALIYFLSAGVVLALTLVRVFDPLTFLGFVLAEAPAIIAASFFELGLLFRYARKKGLPIVNLYSGAWWATAVAIPALLVAGAPLVLFELLRASSIPLAIGAMGGLALIELGACLPVAWWAEGRGSV
ncbi:MAG: hypothetical protein L3K09_00160 [Thermoplasmata archaeon]|nr:hypothetical protein [Thermoplasmata archaeon]